MHLLQGGCKGVAARASAEAQLRAVVTKGTEQTPFVQVGWDGGLGWGGGVG